MFGFQLPNRRRIRGQSVQSRRRYREFICAVFLVDVVCDPIAGLRAAPIEKKGGSAISCAGCADRVAAERVTVNAEPLPTVTMV